jgi:tetratricopeptide (TPR) repeat protein
VAEQLVDGNHPYLEAVESWLAHLERWLAGPKHDLSDETSLTYNRPLHRKEREGVSKWSDSPLLPAQRQRFQSVAAQLCAVAKKFPVAAQSDAFCLAGSCYRAAGQMSQALAAYEKALIVSPKNERAIFLLADLQYVASGKQEMPPPIEAYLISEMASNHIPGLSVGVVHDGELVLPPVTGRLTLSCRSQRQRRPCTRSHRSRSVSRPLRS